MLTAHVFVAALVIQPKGYTPKCPSTEEGRSTVLRPYRGAVFGHEREGSTDTSYSVGNPHTHDAQCKRLHTKDHMCVIALTGNVENRQLHRQKVDEWLPGRGREEGGVTYDGYGAAVGKPDRGWNQRKVVVAHLNIPQTTETHTVKWFALALAETMGSG